MSGLFGSTILEVVLGLAFIYTLLSLLCSSINELLAGFLKLRARNLERAIQNILCDEDLVREVLGHPLIKAMGSTRAETTGVKVGAGQGTRKDFAGKPSYIPSRTFAVALFDTITPPTGRSITVGDVQRAAEEMAGAVEKRAADLTPRETIGRALSSLINESRDPQQLFLTVDQVKEVVNSLADPSLDDETRQKLSAAATLDDLRRLIERFPDDTIRGRLIDMLAESQTGLDRARLSIERWFDDAMDRASGVYKRRTQWWLLMIAAAVTLCIGADTFRLYDSLATNPGLRTALVAQAEQQAAAPASDGVLPSETNDGEVSDTPSTDSAEGSLPAPSVGEIFDELDQTSLPFGYSDRPGMDGEEADARDWFRWLLTKISGLLVTMFAIALGAPFWYDTLNRVSNIRAAGKPPASTDASAAPSRST